MNTKVGYGIALALLLVAPFMIYPVFLMKLLCFALFACAFNLILGYGGLLSFGHAAFFGGAAYITGHVIKVWGLPTELGLLVGAGSAAALGYLIGMLAIRRQGIYFAMITLALAQMVYFIFISADFTGGENGLQGVPRGYALGIFDLQDNLTMYYFVLAVFVIGFLIIARAVYSPFGQILGAIRDNEDRATSLGYDVDRYKHLAFVLSAALAGLAGSTKTVVFQLASLTDVHWHTSGEVVLMTLLGGLGTIAGPAVGAGVIVTLQNYLASGPLGAWVPVVLGTIFVVCVLAFRRGIIGELHAMLKKSF
ncbi:branched-chain amino acid ABC transporter permease [Primorskyibacter aestuariivivens]|jgi:branched-chain amino acid transport system permease protein|uniref:branched-chain amino acid ABC transporter permease n=1 Tax=Primorskyibacter aestuariivivens TaxID=1888912 RepID=UPI0023002387|nr:branched-chain amino acid ABC transporter permease [Primorskyibacter aestuariivivens]MDA7429089.1 branched-chain amino acid ABC transporter permease [Primorskyibacter aestuariivivens]